ncbi:hypothetical protein [Kitasatospora sp. A2-31]|nr:hypothetical protein [Kitasatospora sp. A2-31]
MGGIRRHRQGRGEGRPQTADTVRDLLTGVKEQVDTKELNLAA